VGSAGYSSKYRPGARRFDVGEHANPITMPMLSEGVRQVLEWGVESIQAYCAELARRLLPLTAEGRVRALAPGERVEHILGLRLPEPEALPRIMEALRRRNIHASQRGTSLRVSPHVYNTPDDMDAFCEALGAELG
jgi:selenocysteine lyase/cysteine desulfurase